MKGLDYTLLQKISRRVINGIALLKIDNKRKYSKEFINTWIDEFRTLDESQQHNLYKCIFESQSESIDNACKNNIEYITIPTLGHLRLNKSRQEILTYILNEGSITEDKIHDIINNNIDKKKLIKNPPLIETSLNIIK